MSRGSVHFQAMAVLFVASIDPAHAQQADFSGLPPTLQIIFGSIMALLTGLAGFYALIEKRRVPASLPGTVAPIPESVWSFGGPVAIALEQLKSLVALQTEIVHQLRSMDDRQREVASALKVSTERQIALMVEMERTIDVMARSKRRD